MCAITADFLITTICACTGGNRLLLDGADTLHADPYLIADADDALCLFVSVFVEFGVLIAADEDPHLVVIDLAELVQIQAGDDGALFIQIALGMQVFAEAGADIALRLEPFDFLRLKLAFSVDDANIDLQPVFVLQQLLDAVIELEKGADEYQPFLGAFDQFFKKVIGR